MIESIRRRLAEFVSINKGHTIETLRIQLRDERNESARLRDERDEAQKAAESAQVRLTETEACVAVLARIFGTETKLKTLDEAKVMLREFVLPRLPRCEASDSLDLLDEGCQQSWHCDKPATRSGNCDPVSSLCCDTHKCRHECSELPYAAMVRWLEL